MILAMLWNVVNRVPDQLGCGAPGRPQQLEACRMTELVADIT